MDFKLAMSLKELKHRTSKQTFKGIKLLEPSSREVQRLSENELWVLCHLTRAAKIMDAINMKLEHPQNLEFAEFLKSEIENGNKKAELAKKMFDAQKSMFSPDALGNQTQLAKNVKECPGMGYFPADLDEKEFVEILNRMIDDGKVQEVQNILSQRTIVARDGNELKAIDFVDAFEEFGAMADELEKAKEFSTDKKFNKYLELQIKALRTADPMLDAEADKAWAKLDTSKFEFTITRECYDEKLTKCIYDNDELFEKLKKAGITVYAKDSLGTRVGIVNKTGTKLLKKLKGLVEVAKKYMPYSDEYDMQKEEKQNISQTAVDVDIVTLSGEEGAYQAGIVVAQNLPNDDKLALSVGGGRRNVYHRQIRKRSNKKLYKALICADQFKFYNPEADHWAVICHENTHSLGPKSHGVLGKFSAIMEEFKADMGMYAFLDEFVEAGFFTETQAKQIMVTSLSKSFAKGKPDFKQAHRVRAVMICVRMIESGAISFDGEGKLVFDFEKVKQTAKQMMAEAIRLQLDASVKKADSYVKKWFVWTDDMERVANIIKTHSKMLNGYLIEKLADEFLKPDFEPKKILIKK